MDKLTYDDHRHAILTALDIMMWAERDWEGLPQSILNLDAAGVNWIAAALASEGIGKVKS